MAICCILFNIMKLSPGYMKNMYFTYCSPSHQIMCHYAVQYSLDCFHLDLRRSSCWVWKKNIVNLIYFSLDSSQALHSTEVHIFSVYFLCNFTCLIGLHIHSLELQICCCKTIKQQRFDTVLSHKISISLNIHQTHFKPKL
jgi:hypothetical protein